VKLRRRMTAIAEPPSISTGDIAFNLLVFFLVCASSQPDKGRRQLVPRAESKVEKKDQSDNIEIMLTRTDVKLNGESVASEEFVDRLSVLLAGKSKPEDRIVVVKSAKDLDYKRWIEFTGLIEKVGGTITLQLEEERVITVN